MSLSLGGLVKVNIHKQTNKDVSLKTHMHVIMLNKKKENPELGTHPPPPNNTCNA